MVLRMPRQICGVALMTRQICGVPLSASSTHCITRLFDEVTEGTSQQRGKLTELEFIVSKYNTYPSTPSSTRQEPPSSTSFSRSKRPDLNLPTFSGNITEWFGFWERFQLQLGNSLDLPKAAKLTYLIGQLKGEALTTVKGLAPSD